MCIRDRVYQAIRGGLAGSTVLDATAPMMLARNFQPGGKLSINMKDIKNVLATAHQADVPLSLIHISPGACGGPWRRRSSF